MTQTTATAPLAIPAMRKWEKLPDKIRGEVINGKLYILATPTPYHQDIAQEIYDVVRPYTKLNGLGKTYLASVGVFLNDDSVVVIPDMLFISKDNEHCIIDDRGIHGPPDFHFEVLSPSNRKHDLIRKKNLYQHAGVKEYWIVDPKTKEALGYLLTDGKYGEPLRTNAEIHLRILNKTIPF